MGTEQEPSMYLYEKGNYYLEISQTSLQNSTGTCYSTIQKNIILELFFMKNL